MGDYTYVGDKTVDLEDFVNSESGDIYDMLFDIYVDKNMELGVMSTEKKEKNMSMLVVPTEMTMKN